MFVFTDHKNNIFQKKLMMQNTIYEIRPSSYRRWLRNLIVLVDQIQSIHEMVNKKFILLHFLKNKLFVASQYRSLSLSMSWN